MENLFSVVYSETIRYFSILQQEGEELEFWNLELIVYNSYP